MTNTRSPLSDGLMTLFDESVEIFLRIPLLQPLASGLRLAFDAHLKEKLSVVLDEEGMYVPLPCSVCQSRRTPCYRHVQVQSSNPSSEN